MDKLFFACRERRYHVMSCEVTVTYILFLYEHVGGIVST